MLTTINSILKELLAPPFCAHCQQAFTFLCERCYQKITFCNQNPAQNFEFLDAHIAMAKFEGVTKSLVTSLKYKGQKDIAVTLAKMLHHTLYIPDVDMICVVPAHQQRVRAFGFNHVDLVGSHLAIILETQYSPLLKRTKRLSSQASISNRKERKKRQFQTIAVKKTLSSRLIHCRKVLIVDDVFTTGATLEEAARALKRCNSELTVIGATIAQA